MNNKIENKKMRFINFFLKKKIVNLVIILKYISIFIICIYLYNIR